MSRGREFLNDLSQLFPLPWWERVRVRGIPRFIE